MRCSSSCPTPGAHSTYGECMRAKGVRVDTEGMTAARKAQSTYDAGLTAYADAKRQGIQPANTSKAAADAAIIASNETGRAFQA